MRILLLRPPIVTRNPRNLGRISTGVPIGMLSIAAAAESEGHEVKVFDAVVEFDIRERHDHFHALKARDRECEIHFGASWDAIRSAIRDFRPSIVGISNQYSDYVQEAIEAAAVVKSVDGKIATVVGGPHATVSPETFIHPGSPVDYAVIGEGEKVFTEMLDDLVRGRSPHSRPGVSSLVSGEFLTNPPRTFVDDLDSLPLPAYHLADMERYFLFEELGYRSRTSRASHSPRSVSVMTSRGCPFRCVFCGIHLHMGRRWRPNSLFYVMEHLRKLVDVHRVEHVHFEDDNLTVDPTRFREILDGKRRNGWRFTWDTPNGVRADGLDRDILGKCRETGCLMLGIGVESGDQRVLDQVVRKRLDLSRVTDVARWCSEAGIDLQAFFVIGMPGETKEEIRRTLDFALRLARDFDVLPSVSIAKPLLGTEMYRICEEEGFLTEPIYPSQSSLLWEQDVGMRPMIRTQEFDLKFLEEVYGSYYSKLVGIFRSRLARGILFFPSLWGKCLAILLSSLAKHGADGIRLAQREVATCYWDRTYGIP